MEKGTKFSEKPLEERRRRLEELQLKYPGKIPLVIEKDGRSKLNCAETFRFVSRPTTKFSHFIAQVKNGLQLSETEALYFYTPRGTIVKSESTLLELEKIARAEDGFLYFKFQEVKSFGGCTR